MYIYLMPGVDQTIVAYKQATELSQAAVTSLKIQAR
jgi:hypothetical protein